MVVDPITGAATILAITNASLGIARSLVHTIRELYELAEAYETAAFGIKVLASQCSSFRLAVARVANWLAEQTEDSRYDLDEDFWLALSENLQTSSLVIEDLDKRIAGYKKTPSRWRTRTKYLWNAGVLSELQGQVQSIMAALSILIQVIDMPTVATKRNKSISQKQRIKTLTKSVRSNVEETRKRIAQRQEERELLADIDSLDKKAEPSAPNPKSSGVTVSTHTTAPPPYDYQEDEKQAVDSFGEPTQEVVPDTNQAETEAKTKSKKRLFGRSANPPRPKIEHKKSSGGVAGFFRRKKGSGDDQKDVTSSSSEPCLVPVPSEAAEANEKKLEPVEISASSTILSHEASQPSPVELPATHSATFGEYEQTSGRGSLTDEPELLSRTSTLHTDVTSELSALAITQSSSTSIQKWSTTSIVNDRITFKVQFEPTVFTSRMSNAAAQLLMINDRTTYSDGIPIAHLTLLHIVEDGMTFMISGSEFEFEIMHEYMERKPVLVLGNELVHFGDLMAGGRELYWSPTPIPARLRNWQLLQSCKKFELV